MLFSIIRKCCVFISSNHAVTLHDSCAGESKQEAAKLHESTNSITEEKLNYKPHLKARKVVRAEHTGTFKTSLSLHSHELAHGAHQRKNRKTS